MKKLLVLCLILVLFVTSCSMSPKKYIETEVRWTFDYDDINSIIDTFNSIIVIGDANYDEMIMKKHSSFPKTYYKIGKLQVINEKTDFDKKLEELLEPTNGNVKLKLSCGKLTEMEYYELKAKDPDIKKHLKKPSASTANRPIHMGLGGYIELDKKDIYLVFANFRSKTNIYHSNVYGVFKYDKASKSFINETSGLKVTLNDIIEKIKK